MMQGRADKCNFVWYELYVSTRSALKKKTEGRESGRVESTGVAARLVKVGRYVD